jgi:hypothetical protein
MKTMTLHTNQKHPSFLKFSLMVGVSWTIILSGLFAWGVKQELKQTNEVLTHQARSFFQLIVTARSWNAIHGGVYVPVTETSQPNPYLEDPDRDLLTDKDFALTKINPAYMTKQIGKIASEKNEVGFHITSDKPINPKNVPDPWEVAGLNLLSSQHQEHHELVESETGKRVFRYMAPLWVEQECLQCHAKQGYKEGDMRGGISVSIWADPIIDSQNSIILIMALAYLGIWALALLGFSLGMKRLRKERERIEEMAVQLQKAIFEIKTLSGLLPICASCKKIRDDRGYWNQIESYISEHSEAGFTHSLCPDCLEQLYGDQDWYKEQQKDIDESDVSSYKEET